MFYDDNMYTYIYDGLLRSHNTIYAVCVRISTISHHLTEHLMENLQNKSLVYTEISWPTVIHAPFARTP